MGQELERELNVHLDGIGRKEEILSLQLHRLLLGMDVYLESACLGDNPAEFPKEKLFFAQARCESVAAFVANGSKCSELGFPFLLFFKFLFYGSEFIE